MVQYKTSRSAMKGTLSGGIQASQVATQEIVFGDQSILDTASGAGGGGGDYTLPTASDTAKGGVKVGTGLSMTGEVLSADTLPTASDTVKGGVKVGTGLSMTGEVLSADGGSGGSAGVYFSAKDETTRTLSHGSETHTITTLADEHNSNQWSSGVYTVPSDATYRIEIRVAGEVRLTEYDDVLTPLMLKFDATLQKSAAGSTTWVDLGTKNSFIPLISFTSSGDHQHTLPILYPEYTPPGSILRTAAGTGMNLPLSEAYEINGKWMGALQTNDKLRLVVHYKGVAMESGVGGVNTTDVDFRLNPQVKVGKCVNLLKILEETQHANAFSYGYSWGTVPLSDLHNDSATMGAVYIRGHLTYGGLWFKVDLGAQYNFSDLNNIMITTTDTIYDLDTTTINIGPFDDMNAEEPTGVAGTHYFSSTPDTDGHTISSISIDTAGSGYVDGTLSATGGNGSGFAATYTVDGSGGIDAITFQNAGTGYTTAPTINITEGPGGGSGSNATFTATLRTGGYRTFLLQGPKYSENDLGAMTAYPGHSQCWIKNSIPTEGTTIASLSISSGGSGYHSEGGLLTATGGGGSGFAGTYEAGGGVVLTVSITNPGSGYTSDPTIVLSAPGSGAVITPTRTPPTFRYIVGVNVDSHTGHYMQLSEIDVKVDNVRLKSLPASITGWSVS